MKIGDIEYPSLKGKVTDAEWQRRVDLAALYRLVPMLGWWDLSQPPLSARVPGEPDHYLFNPLGFLFEEITASSLIKITLDGKKVDDTPLEFSRRIWYPMQAVHAVREDAQFVIHSHDEVFTAMSARTDVLLPISQPAAFVLAGGVAYHEYDGVETYEEQMASIQRSLGKHGAMILKNHGFVGLGRSAYEIVAKTATIRQACQVQLLAGHSADVQSINETVLPAFEEELRRGVAVDNLWAALLRKLDRADATFRD